MKHILNSYNISYRFYWLFPPDLMIGVGVSLVDNMVFPIMGLLVDTRHMPIYGSVFAITDAALCAAFAFGRFI